MNFFPFRPSTALLYALLLLLFLLFPAAKPVSATTLGHEDMICGYCGKSSSQSSFRSFSFPYGPGLDLQPHRLILDAKNIKECPHCGYLAVDFSTPPTQAVREAFTSQAYSDIAKETLPETTSKFLRAAFLEEAGHDFIRAGQHLADAAWLFDVGEALYKAEMERLEAAEEGGGERWNKDAWYEVNDPEALPRAINLPARPQVDPALLAKGVECRTRAISLLEKALAEPNLAGKKAKEKKPFSPLYRLTELYRRAGDFPRAAQALKQARAALNSDPNADDMDREGFNLFLDLQQELINAKDASWRSRVNLRERP